MAPDADSNGDWIQCATHGWRWSLTEGDCIACHLPSLYKKKISVIPVREEDGKFIVDESMK